MSDICRRIAVSGLAQDAIAYEAGIHPSAFSRVLRGLRKPPPGFEARVIAAIELLEAAEQAASQARERVLAEGRST